MFLEAILDLKRQIGRIAHDLDFYGNQMRGETPLADEAREKFRRHVTHIAQCHLDSFQFRLGPVACDP